MREVDEDDSDDVAVKDRKQRKEPDTRTSATRTSATPTLATPSPALGKTKRREELAPGFADDLAEARSRWQQADRRANQQVPATWSTNTNFQDDELRPQPFGDPFPMPELQEGTQRMVASAVDLMDVKALQEMRPEFYGKLTANQVWVLVAAERKGQLLLARDRDKAAKRLMQLNKDYGTRYEPIHLGRILAGIRKRRLATNYYLTLPPGSNVGLEGTDSLLDQLIADPERRFRNVWETGTSQASTSFGVRGGVEEGFGYAFALKRVAGNPLTMQETTNKFRILPDPVELDELAGDDLSEDEESDLDDLREHRRRGDEYLRAIREEMPNYLDPREMPKYAAAVGPSQAFGVAARYGSSVLYWKNEVDRRSTRTPGDSWSGMSFQSSMSFVGVDYPETIFANTDDHVARLAAAEATNFRHDPELRKKLDSAGSVDLSGYIEVQIHGDLAWSDVAEVVLNWGTFPGKDKPVQVSRDAAQESSRKLTEFAKKYGYTFTVTMGRERRVEDDSSTSET